MQELSDENSAIRLLIFDQERINQAVYIGAEGQAFNVPLMDIIVHELAHAADVNVDEYNKLIAQTMFLQEEYGIKITPDGIRLNTSSDFFKQLPEELQDILIDLREAQPSIFDDRRDIRQYRQLLEESKEMLQEHPILREMIRLGEQLYASNQNLEDYALLAENTFRNEIANRPDLQQRAAELGVDVSQHFHRLSYEATDVDEIYANIKPGSIFHHSLSVEERLHFIRINEEWQQRFGQYDRNATTIPNEELRESQFLDEIDRMNDILPPELREFIQANVQYDATVTLTERDTFNANIAPQQQSGNGFDLTT